MERQTADFSANGNTQVKGDAGERGRGGKQTEWRNSAHKLELPISALTCLKTTQQDPAAAQLLTSWRHTAPPVLAAGVDMTPD